MQERLREIEAKYAELERKMAEPEYYSDAEAYAKLAKEQKELAPLATACREYFKCEADIADAKELLSDPEMAELAREELEAAKARLEELEEEIKLMMLPGDPNDGKNVIIEIRAGVGGEESALFAGSLYRMYSMYAESRRWKLEVANVNDTELGGIKEISFVIEGAGAYSRLKYESGVHRVQRVPETEASGRIHTSTVTVAVLPEVDEVEFQINPADLQIDTFRSSGAGGQHVNKTSSAIRVTHLPTGMVVECQDERSQYKNKDKALKVLRSRLLAEKQQAQKDAIDADRRSQVGAGDRSERIRTYNFPQGRVTDHRIGLTLYKLDSVMDGALDELLNALITADQTRRLQAAQEKEATL